MGNNEICYIIVAKDSEPMKNYGPYKNFSEAEKNLKEQGWTQTGEHSRFWRLNDTSITATAGIEVVKCLPRNQLPRK